MKYSLIILLLICRIAFADEIINSQDPDNLPTLEFLPQSLKSFENKKPLIEAKYNRTKV
jgi:hypothetical protein